MATDVRNVICAGAGGGLVSWAFTIMTGGGFGVNLWAALPLCIVLGVAAALVAVYVVTPTDVTKTGRLIGFAVFCGFLWKPVLDASRVVLSQHLQVAQNAVEVKKEVSELKAASTPAEVGASANKVADNAAELLRSSESLQNPKLEESAAVQATVAVDAIVETSTANPLAARLALEEIKRAAVESNNPRLATLATRRIATIRQRAPTQLAPPVTRTE